MSGYIGSQPADSFLSISSQQITGNGGATYTLNLSVTSPEDVAVFVNNVRQNPNTYSVSNNQITLGGTISSSDSCYVIFLGKTLATVNPPSSSVGLNELSATGTKNSTTFLRGDNTFAEAGGGKILQVVSGFKNDKSSTTSSSYVAISGLTASLTPSSTSSKVFIICHLGTVSTSTANRQQMFAFHRDIGGAGYSAIGESSGSTRNFAFGDNFASISSPQDTYNAFGHSFLDSPNTTSAVTYKLYHKVFQHPDLSGTPTGAVGGRQADGSFGGSCSITIMEVGA